MTRSGSERAITVSALIVVGIYTYRRLTEGSAPAPTGQSKLKQLAGQGSPPSIGEFITAWGLTYLVISIMASIAPGLGGSFAILVAVADALGNTSQVAADVNTKIAGQAGAKAATGALSGLGTAIQTGTKNTGLAATAGAQAATGGAVAAGQGAAGKVTK